MKHLFLILFFLSFSAHALEGIRLCREIAAALEERPAYDEAHVLYPQDPVRRALAIRKAYGDLAIPFTLQPAKTVMRDRPRFQAEDIETYDWLIPHTVTGYHPSVRAYADMALNTVRYASPNDLVWRGNFVESAGAPPMKFKKLELRPHENSEIIVDWSHGLTGIISNAGRVFGQMKVMNGSKPSSRTILALKNMGYWHDSTAVATDRPFHGAGPFDPALSALDASLAWRARYYETLREPGLPLVAASRSGESLFLSQLALQRPELFNGLILMSPMHPTMGFQEAVEGYKRQTVDTGVAINPLALNWFANSIETMLKLPAERQWWNQREIKTPTLILVGEKDAEVPEATRAAYRELARKNPKTVFYVEVPGASHDVFCVTEDYVGSGQRWSAEAEARATGAWQYVYWFNQTQILKRDAPVPSLGWLHQ